MSSMPGPSGPMDVHASKSRYFAALHSDPYGLNNPLYDWSGEDRFVYWSALFYGSILAGVFVAIQAGWCNAPGPRTYIAFAVSVAVELSGRIVFSYMVQNWNIKINYARKLGLRPWRKLSNYVIPLIVVAGDSVVTDTILLCCLDQLKIILTDWHHMRRNVCIFRYAFVAWDRLEDRPYTLRYDMIEDILRFAVYLPFMVALNEPIVILIPNLINELGDGLAEPVGIRFGTHRYRARALWYNGKFWHGDFVRSLEGSCVVFIVSQLVLIFYASTFTLPQFAIAMVLLPWLMTLAEAFSPHTCDGPFLALVGCLFLLVLQSF